MLLRTVNCINFSIKRILHGGANGKYFPVYFSVSLSISLSVSELLEYRHMSANVHKFQKFTISIYL